MVCLNECWDGLSQSNFILALKLTIKYKPTLLAPSIVPIHFLFVKSKAPLLKALTDGLFSSLTTRISEIIFYRGPRHKEDDDKEDADDDEEDDDDDEMMMKIKMKIKMHMMIMMM